MISAAAEVLAAAGRFAHLRFFHATVTTATSEVLQVDYAAPDRMGLVSPHVFALTIGDVAYLPDGGRLTEMPMPKPLRTMMRMIRFPSGLRSSLPPHQVRLIGKLSNDEGMHVHRYAFIVDRSGERLDAIMDVADTDGLPRRIVFSRPNGKPTTVRYGKFDVPVDLSPPG